MRPFNWYDWAVVLLLIIAILTAKTEDPSIPLAISGVGFAILRRR